MNELAVQLPLLGLLCTSQSVSSSSIPASFDFTASVLGIASVIIVLFSVKGLKRSQVLSLKSFVRATVLVIAVACWGWSVNQLGAARSVTVEVVTLISMPSLMDKRRDMSLLGLCAGSFFFLLLSSPNALAPIIAVGSIVSRELFNLFRDSSTIVVGAGMALILAGFAHLSGFAATHAPAHSSEHSSRAVSLSWTFASALLWIAPIALAPVYDEKWFEFSQNKRNRLVLSISCVVMFFFVDRSLHLVTFFIATGLSVALVIQRKPKAERSILPTSVKDNMDAEIAKKTAMVNSLWMLQRISLGPVVNFFREANGNRDSQKILQFLTLTLSFMFVELVMGLYTGSLGLISDAGHMFFDSAALFIGLFAAFASKWQPDNSYTYGYGRYETIAGFVNAVFLTFVAVFVLTESLERFSEPPTIRTEGLLLTSVLGLVVNAIGLVFFHEHAHSHGGDGGHSHGASGGAKRTASTTARDHQSKASSDCGHDHSHATSHSHAHGGSHGHSHGTGHNHTHSHSHSHGTGGHHHSHEAEDNGHDPDHEDVEEEEHGHHQHHGHSHTNENMHGVFLHVLADALGSVGVIISSLLIQYKGWYIADPVCSFCISVLIFLSVLPLLKSTASSLLLRVPPEHERRFDACIERLKRRPGVAKVVRAHLWRLSKDQVIATVNVLVHSREEQDSLTAWLVSTMKNEVGATEVTVQVCTESLNRMLYQ